VLLHFEDDLRGVMTVSQVSAGRKASLSFEVDGTNGSLAWDSESPNSMWLGRRDNPSEIVLKDPSQLSPAARVFAAYPAGHAEGYPDTFKQLYRDVYSYIEAGKFDQARPFPTFADGLYELQLCEAILTSHQEQRWITL